VFAGGLGALAIQPTITRLVISHAFGVEDLFRMPIWLAIRGIAISAIGRVGGFSAAGGLQNALIAGKGGNAMIALTIFLFDI
jgi:hypothetical protein